MQGVILKQLKDLKELKNGDVISIDEFNKEREKLTPALINVQKCILLQYRRMSHAVYSILNSYVRKSL